MNVNDILLQGLSLFFSWTILQLQSWSRKGGRSIQGVIVKGCRMAECVLLGGETAEMPGFYNAGEYDLAGFTVGIVKKRLNRRKSKLNAETPGRIASSGSIAMAIHWSEKSVKKSHTFPRERYLLRRIGSFGEILHYTYKNICKKNLSTCCEQFTR